MQCSEEAERQEDLSLCLATWLPAAVSCYCLSMRERGYLTTNPPLLGYNAACFWMSLMLTVKWGSAVSEVCLEIAMLNLIHTYSLEKINLVRRLGYSQSRNICITKEDTTFTFRAFGRHFYPKRLTKSTFVERDSNISLWYIKIRIEQVSSIHNCKANRMSFIIARLPA